jgi:Tol biopolymer transport system component
MSDLRSARLRLEQGSTFQRSGAMLQLLDFLLDAASVGPIKETYVGVAFYKREASYDPRYDSIARVNVRRLRQRLEHFYATEGTDESFQIVIPVGSFTPVLQPRESISIAMDASADADADPFSTLVGQPPGAVRSRRIALWWSGIGVLVLVGCCFLLLAKANRHREVPFSEGHWRTQPLTTGHDLEFEPATTRDGKRLAYVSRAQGQFRFQIFLRNLVSETTAETLLDTGAGDAFYPAWSPDSSEIAFLHCGVGHCMIETVSLRDRTMKQVRALPLYVQPDDQPYYQFRQLGPVWTGDGRSLIYPYQAVGNNAERLVLQNLATGAVRQLTFGEPGDDDGAPAISSDGTMVAYLRRQLDHTDVMVLDLKSGKARVLETEPSHAPSGITWAHDGSGVVVGIVRRESAPGLLWVPLQGAPRVLDVRLPGLLNPVFTGDGKALMVLSSNRNRNIAEVSGDETTPDPIFRTKQKNSFSALSPDTHRLAFLSSLSGSFEVWISERQGKTFSSPRQLTHGLPYYPVSVAWAPDGRTLAVGISHTSRVEMVDVETGAFQALQLPGLEHSIVSSPAWSADGRSIYLAVQGERNGIVRASASLISGVQAVWTGDAQELRLETDRNGDRALYFTTGNTLGIYRLPLSPGSAPELLVALAQVDPARAWFVDGGKLYYLDVHDLSRRLQAYDPISGQISVVTQPLVRPAFLDGSLDYVVREHLLLYSEWSDEAGSQIFLLYPSGKPLNEEDGK